MSAKKTNKMTYNETKAYLDGQPLALALWWFIENVTDDDIHRSELFFCLRERVRDYQTDPDPEI